MSDEIKKLPACCGICKRTTADGIVLSGEYCQSCIAQYRPDSRIGRMMEKKSYLPKAKRCAQCKLSRADGVIIDQGQGYCRTCFKDYRQRYRQMKEEAKKKKEGQE